MRVTERRALVATTIAVGLLAGGAGKAREVPSRLAGGEAKLLASDGAQGDTLGTSVAISGNIVVVGAPNEQAESGSVYVYVRPPGGWLGPLVEVAKLNASDPSIDDHFGRHVAISGGTIVIASQFDDDNGSNAGAAYVFTEPPGGWAGSLTEDAKLLASDGGENDRFGASVAVADGTIVIGASLSDGDVADSGSAYVFLEPPGGWAGGLTEDAKLQASDGGEFDRFGYSVAVSGATVAVGAYADDENGPNSGSVYVFTEPPGGWAGVVEEAARLQASDCTDHDWLGRSVAISGGTVVAGCEHHHGGHTHSGSAYVFTEPPGGWAGTRTEDAKLRASDHRVADELGRTVAISGSVVVAGTPGNGHADGNLDGFAYVFVEPAGGWSGLLGETTRLEAFDGARHDDFGAVVAVAGGTVVAGAPFDDDLGDDSGSAYVFPEILFMDGFESGDTSAWSLTFP